VPHGARTIGSVTATSDRETHSTVRLAAYSPRRIALTVVIVLACMALGLVAGKWQWGRYETKSHTLHAQQRAAELPTVPLESIMTTDDVGPGAAEWRKVTVTGVIAPTDLVQLRGRTIDTNASIQYLAWIHTSPKGQTVLLNLGWTPRDQPTVPRIPSGVVTVTGTVRALEPDNGKPGTRINPTQMGGIDGKVFGAYVMVDSACGAGGCLSGTSPVPLPELSLGPHLSYAMQWGLLLVAAAPIGVWLTVRDARLERERLRGGVGSTQDEHKERPASEPRGVPAKRAHPSDEEIEDAL
jgi:cytochrome oxidase assembly protein ShyY1